MQWPRAGGRRCRKGSVIVSGIQAELGQHLRMGVAEVRILDGMS